MRTEKEIIRLAAARAAILFHVNNWEWAIFPDGPRVPTIEEIEDTFTNLVNQIETKEHGDEIATGRLRVKKTQYLDEDTGSIELSIELGSINL